MGDADWRLAGYGFVKVDVEGLTAFYAISANVLKIIGDQCVDVRERCEIPGQIGFWEASLDHF